MLEVFDRNRQRVAILENAYGVKEDQKINALWYLDFTLPENRPDWKTGAGIDRSSQGCDG